jgi:hypothetical protein
MTEQREYHANETTGTFDSYSATRYEKFDNKLNVENLWVNYPFIPGLVFWRNNYTAMSSYYFDGKQETETSAPSTFQYEYLENGYPAYRHKKTGTYNLSTTYNYYNFQP